jgi:hypothetical protein
MILLTSYINQLQVTRIMPVGHFMTCRAELGNHWSECSQFVQPFVSGLALPSLHNCKVPCSGEQRVQNRRFTVKYLTAFPIFFRHVVLRYTDVSTVMIMVCCGLRTTLAVKQYDILYYRGRPKTCVYVLPLNPRVVYSTGRSPTNISQDLYTNIRLTRTQMLVFENKKVQCGLSWAG